MSPARQGGLPATPIGSFRSASGSVQRTNGLCQLVCLSPTHIGRATTALLAHPDQITLFVTLYPRLSGRLWLLMHLGCSPC